MEIENQVVGNGLGVVLLKKLFPDHYPPERRGVK
jgi:hypothetical protein